MTAYQIALLYAVGALIVGAFVATMNNVNFTFHGRPVRYPRVATFLMAALLWPFVILKMIFKP
jgi:hypothetical protein